MSNLQKLRAEVKALVDEGYIESIPEVDNLPKRALQKLIRNNKPIGLNTLNETLCVGLVDSLSVLCRRSQILSDKTVDSLRNDLLESDVFVTQSTGVIEKVTTHASTIGLVVAGVIVGGYVVERIRSAFSRVFDTNTSTDEEVL